MMLHHLEDGQFIIGDEDQGFISHEFARAIGGWRLVQL
jgi:hypothetical protein